ncbi:MAG: hypothetical protein HOP12_09695 [Candidatus Eisenbacteria bacterium]|uniref:Uncharacterized protein n=1 Tax=Eiseniibacteriota bacterium TaxID=2212470 RepID=A0A849SZB6_UNCEI|nr:hypothetical protein [Candidatus Eisenbacteria bacterium]
MQNESLDFHIVGAIIFTLLAHLHSTSHTKDQRFVRWVALCSVCGVALLLTLRHVGAI